MTRPRRFANALRVTAAAALLVAGGALAAPPGQGSLCRPPKAGVPVPAAPPAPESATGIVADQAELRRTGPSDILGRVVLKRGDQTVAADTVTYYREADRVEALDGVRFWSGEMYAQAAQGQLDLTSEDAWLEDVHYRFLTTVGHGDARSASMTGSGLTVIDAGSYTTCDPGSEDWVIRAREITLDRPEDLGVARDATLRFKGLPVLYTPYLDFPLSGRRKSGLLPPLVGSSDKRGFELVVPYYWNIAPERDATLRVGELTKRGPLLGGEYRYLMPTGKGNLQFEVIPHDQKDGGTRGTGQLQHRQTFAGSWWTTVDAAVVSDDRYVEDLGTSLKETADQFLEQRVDVGTSGSGWSALGRLQHYTTVDPDLARAGRPYARLPQLLLNVGTPERFEGLAAGMQTELVRFAQPDRVEGNRADLYPTLSYPLRTLSTFLVPKVGARYTSYQLSDDAPGTAADPRPAGSSDTPDRFVPTVSVDAGAFFDRETSFGGRALVQTLEPRVYYLYVPYRDQDDLPIFDTANYTFSFYQLFRENRFSGADRVGDANQIALALTSRLADEDSGAELARVSVGQVQYFRDRKVQLPYVETEDGHRSDYVGELATFLGASWQVRGTLLWNPRDERTDRSSVVARYRPAPGQVFNVGYQYLREQVDQTDVSLRWQLNPQWSVVGRWNYELPTTQTIDTFAGFEYESCCWGMRAVARRFLTDDDTYSNGLFLQLVLKGLGGFGEGTTSLLREHIPGYEDYF